ncbi:7-keto-8-aminopelargonate synthetase-like enzyme [Maritimibacter alkaliphilus HTCC2654]|uniref:Acyl-transferase transferase protein n=1 Tax=Maritimibacter alkaliphilus HTCC2654 TaxID=314271 RepID=A3VIF9_9RHOB|nr:aminotransferase class I/II-fold pyridoxal phosphate-dependent enzyme [Maritimibacter alkaliphilus]EAQ11890.1 acyl-transferase transferase protein [Rhodobacterales bacterium HTCC2654] [Maritimibacter alkaliphilus HTCC2654]TYP85689.1 7-keto-8-aminopelargonate synthetase-like enzyme [Maritimibacter alkaliphilus HTCC2654]
MTSGSNALSGDARARALSAARAAQKKPSNKSGPIIDHKPNPSFDQLAGYKERLALRQISKLHDLGDPSFRQHDGHPGAISSIEGRDVINFGSYDYIGLNADPRPAEVAKAAIDTYGVSASASRLTAGERPIHRELEGRLAAHYGVEDALTFVSGHATNVSAVATVVGKDDLVIYDSYIHNSASVGATLSGATRRSFPHNDMDALETILAETAGRYRYTLVLVEGHYSMDGDIPDLPRVLDLKKRFGFWLLVDEAHGLGCIGKTGGGMREYYGLSGDEVDIWMGTLSKSLGSTGGYLAGSAAMIDAMKYEAPGSVYSVALAPVLAAAANEAIQIMHAEPERVARLHARGSFFLDVAKSLGLDTGASVGSSITPIMVGSSPLAAAASKVLLEEGINALPIAFPGVPMNQARLRFFITSEHSEDQIRHSLTTTAEILSRLREGPLQDLMKSLSNTF